MKESRYNHYYKMPDGADVVYNAISSALAVIDDRYHELIRILPTVSESSDVPVHLKDVFDSAVRGMYVVDGDLDELQLYSIQRGKSKFQSRNLGLTIAPTLDCNFGCTYCYEKRTKGTMSQEVQNGIINFASTYIGEIQKLNLVWYGGEPLLEPKVISALSEKLIRNCAEKGVEYEAFIITNGSLISQETITLLRNGRIRGVQITLDGPPAVHDKRRMFLDGSGSFDLLVKNIALLLDAKIKVHVRINVDTTNFCCVKELMSELAARIPVNALKISLGRVVEYACGCKTRDANCLVAETFGKQMLAFNRLKREFGIDDGMPFPLPICRPVFCAAERANSFVIDPSGDLYKCWNVIGDKRYAVGNVVSETHFRGVSQNTKWLGREFPNRTECGECDYLPICGGGCLYETSVRKSCACDFVKYNLKDMIEEYYRQFLQLKNCNENERSDR